MLVNRNRAHARRVGNASQSSRPVFQRNGDNQTSNESMLLYYLASHKVWAIGTTQGSLSMVA